MTMFWLVPLLWIDIFLTLTFAFPLSTHRQCGHHRCMQIPLRASNNESNLDYDEVQRLKQSAEILRAEAMAAQADLASRRSSSGSRAVEMPVQTIEYDEAADSCWEIT